MWGLYRQARLAIFDSDIEEPTVSQLKERPAMLLKHLCASRYLDHLIDTDGSPPLSLLDFELQCMGEDRIRNVFAVDGGGYG